MIEYKKARKLDDLVVAEYPDQLIISHKEGTDQGSLCLRPEEFDSMSGPQILKRFNAYIDSILDGILSDRPVEIADGEPQLKWRKASRQWTPAGGVLRCEVSWHPTGPEGAIAIKIDDQLLSGKEFLKVLEVNEGYGMRIEFMHPNRLTNPPEPKKQVEKDSKQNRER